MTAAPFVLVVGAGPTGLLLAAELRRRGVACRVIDAHAQVLAWDRATVVHPRSLEVFESLGLLDAFLAAGTAQRAARVYSDGAVLGEIDLEGCGSRHAFNLGISEQVTEAILTEHLHALGGAVERGVRLVELEVGPDGPVATLEHDGVRETVAADWVVGCDGLHSLTRERAGVELVGHDILEPWAVFDVTLEPWAEAYDVNHVYLDTLAVILTALPDRRWRVYVRPSGADSDFVADAAGTIARYAPAARLVDVTDPRRFSCHTKVASRLRVGRILLAGDAAHVCSPAQGHGMNSGIQDAFNLAWKLALVCAGDAGEALLDSYEAERRPVAERITRSGDETEHAQTLTDPQERLARDATLRAVLSDPQTRHQEAIAEAELDTDYADSPIVLGGPRAGLWPGQRLPDTLVARPQGGEPVPLYELINRAGHTAILIGADGALRGAVAAAARPAIVEATIAVEAEGDLGADAPTLVVVRPDGHIGAIAGGDHAEVLAAYQARLAG